LDIPTTNVIVRCTVVVRGVFIYICLLNVKEVNSHFLNPT